MVNAFKFSFWLTVYWVIGFILMLVQLVLTELYLLYGLTRCENAEWFVYDIYDCLGYIAYEIMRDIGEEYRKYQHLALVTN